MNFNTVKLLSFSVVVVFITFYSCNNDIQEKELVSFVVRQADENKKDFITLVIISNERILFGFLPTYLRTLHRQALKILTG